MATDVVMPQMGESIAEGTIVRWIKKVGDKVDRDEPLFEISTDKVDAEIPSPAAGVVSEIRVKEGETVPVNSVVAVIGAAAGALRRARTPPSSRRRGAGRAPEPPQPSPQADGSPAPPAATRQAQPAAPSGHYHERDDLAAAAARPRPRRRRRPPKRAPDATQSQRRHSSTEDAIRERSSPLVRKIAKEHNVDISQIQRHRHRRARDEGRHPRRSSGRKAGRREGGRAGSQAGRPEGGEGGKAGRQAACAGVRRAGAAGAAVQAWRVRSRREDVADAQEHRRAHGR